MKCALCTNFSKPFLYNIFIYFSKASYIKSGNYNYIKIYIFSIPKLLILVTTLLYQNPQAVN